MDHSGEAATPVTAETFEPGRAAGAGAVHVNTGAFDGHLGLSVAVPVFGGELGLVVPVFGGELSLAMQRHPGARLREVLVGVLPGGDYDALLQQQLQPRPRPGAGLGDVLVGALPGGDYDALQQQQFQPRPNDGLCEVLVGVLPDGDVLQDGAGAVYSHFGGSFAGSGRAAGTVGALAGDLGAVHDNPGAPAQLLRRLLPLAAITFFSAAVTGLAAGPSSTAAALDNFSLFLGGMFLVILHVLRA